MAISKNKRSKFRLYFSALKCMIGILLITGLFSFLIPEELGIKTSYQIEQNSALFINGSSNVNNFTCNCEQQFAKNSFLAEIPNGGNSIRFKETILKVNAKSLDCGKKRMNNDMYETLKAEEFPYIFIELHHANLVAASHVFNDDWKDFKASATITIAGVPQKVDLLISGKKSGDNLYRFISHKDLYLSSFNLDTPKALLGLIKVHDCININFDLAIRVMEDS